MLYGSVIFSILAFFVNTHFTGKFINYTAWHQTRDLLPIIAIALTAGAAVFSVDHVLIGFNSHDFARILLSGFMGVFIFTILSIVFKIEALYELNAIIRRK